MHERNEAFASVVFRSLILGFTRSTSHHDPICFETRSLR
jgi:hypothetical protein